MLGPEGARDRVPWTGDVPRSTGDGVTDAREVATDAGALVCRDADRLTLGDAAGDLSG